MIPPAWIALFAAADAVHVHMTRDDAQEMITTLESMGMTLAPTYAFDKSKIPQGVKIPDDIPPLDPRAFLSEEEIEAAKYFTVSTDPED